MKKVFGIIFFVGVLVLFVYVGYFLYQKNQEDPVVYESAQPFYTDIFKKTVANGSIKPRREIALKPQIPGIIDEIFVEAGEQVKKGQVIARIKVIPDDLSVNNAEGNLRRARISLEEAKKEKERREQLFKDKVIAESEYNRFLYDYERMVQEVRAAEDNLQLLKEGVTSNQKQTTTLVKSTITGKVLDVPIEEGEQVIQSNNFNEGTTIATVADMNDLIFEGMVDESEVGKISEGMDLLIKVGAIEDKKFDAVLEYISPKGIDDQGTIQFEIRAALNDIGDTKIRAGYSANADIILDSRSNVMAIKERDVLFEEGKKFVEVETGDQEFKKREVKLGLSDGIVVEVLSGLEKDEKIKLAGANDYGAVNADKDQLAKETASTNESDTLSDAIEPEMQEDEDGSGNEETQSVKSANTNGEPIYHEVTSYNTLYRISQKYEVSVDQLKDWNGLTTNTISTGQQLIVGYK